MWARRKRKSFSFFSFLFWEVYLLIITFPTQNNHLYEQREYIIFLKIL